MARALRYNTGASSPYTAKETLEKLQAVAEKYKKPLYVDIKGRQLRIIEWATFPFGPIVLNHTIELGLPAKIYFRGDDACDIKEVIDGRKIYVEPFPKFPVGKGQSVNILAKDLKIKEDLTDYDREYLKASRELGIDKFLLSFVESKEYIASLEKELGSKCFIVLKIESAEGVEFVRNAGKSLGEYLLMAARDDLMIQIGAFKMLEALELIAKSTNAVCASRLLMGLEQGAVSMADISDIRLMENLGYGNFMLSDGISRNHYKKALAFWAKYERSKKA